MASSWWWSSTYNLAQRRRVGKTATPRLGRDCQQRARLPLPLPLPTSPHHLLPSTPVRELGHRAPTEIATLFLSLLQLDIAFGASRGGQGLHRH
jgi:hypothetical protein